MARNKRGITLAEFFVNIYLPSAKTRKRSWKIDEGIFNRHIGPHFGAKKLSGITFRDVANWFEGKSAAGYAPATCNRMLAVLRAIFNMALQRGEILERSPCSGIRPFKIPGSRERFLEKSETRKLIMALDSKPCREAMAIKLLILTGARKSEIIHARKSDVDFERRILTVPVSKSGKKRFIHLSGAAIKILRALFAGNDSEWLFPAKKAGKPVCDIFYFWKRLRKSIGLADVRIHDLRHTFASILVSSGQSLFITQKLLGHQSPATTMRYAHLDNSSFRMAVELISRYLGIKDDRGGKRGRKINNINDSKYGKRNNLPLHFCQL